LCDKRHTSTSRNAVRCLFLKSFRVGPQYMRPVLTTDKFDTVRAVWEGGY
jgi:hypothetical protein